MHNVQSTSARSAGAALTEEQLYAYDTRGFLHVPGFLSTQQLAEVSGFLSTPPDSIAHDTQIRRWSRLHKRHPAVATLVHAPQVIGPVTALINQPLRIVECYGHQSGDGSFLYMHNGGAQDLVYSGGIHATRNMAYRCEYHDGRLYTTYLKAIFYLTEIANEGGPFCYVEGSHKANFAFPWPEKVRTGECLLSESGHPAVRFVPVAAGDVIFLNEALLHGASRRRRGGERALLAASYCPSFMADWAPLDREAGDLETLGYPDLQDEVDFFERGGPH